MSDRRFQVQSTRQAGADGEVSPLPFRVRGVTQRSSLRALITLCATTMVFGGGLITAASAQSAGDGRVTRSTPATRSAPSRAATTSRSAGAQRGGSRSGGSSVGRSGSRRHVGDGRNHGRRGGSYQRRGGSRSSRHGYGYGSYYRSPFFYYGLGYPFSWWVGSNYGPYGGWDYGYGPYGRGYGYGGGGSYYRAGAVSLDLDISPEEAQIFVDGKLVGTADNYDGFPRYLWLDAGTHNLVIYHEGYETLGKRITLEPGDSLRLKDKMVAGTAKSAGEMYAQLSPTSEATTRDTGREQLAPWRFKDREVDDAGSSPEVARRMPRTEAGAASPRSREDWRQRGGSARSADVDIDLRAKPAKVEFVVEPADAAIYVDGKLIGSAAQLAELGQPVLLDAGEHVVEVSRPGFKDQRAEFNLESGETETVTVTLERTP